MTARHSPLLLPQPLPDKGRAETPMAFIRAIAQALEAGGVSVGAALEKAQIEPKLLKKPNARVTALQMEVLSATAMQALDDEALGWFERRLPWGSYGMLVRASLTAPNLGVALKRWCRHHNLLTHTVALHVHEHNGVAQLQLKEQRPLGAAQEFCVVSVLRNALGVACWLTDSRIALQCTTLRFAEPKHHTSYSVLFDGPTQFGAEHNSLQFDAGYLSLPIRRDETALQHMLERALLLTVRPYRRDRLLVERVRQTLAQHPEHSHNADALAAWLNMSARSLHRQLKEEGASLQELKNHVRQDMAMAQLQRTQKPIKQIAQACGFRNEKSFTRAFKTWTGSPPQAFRSGMD